jgi:hypothetical protein
MLRRISRLNRQNLRPVLPVIIRQHHGNRRPDRLPMPHAAQNMRRIPLDPHPPAASIPLLPPPQFAIDKLLLTTTPAGIPLTIATRLSPCLLLLKMLYPLNPHGTQAAT